MAVARKSKADKELDKLTERTYYKHGDGVQINVMDIGNIYRDFRVSVLAGTDPDAVMIAIISKYRLN